MDTDIKGKMLASQVIKCTLGVEFHPTEDEFNILDGWFEYKGKNYGLEIKNMCEGRYFKFNDVLIAPNKYEYSIGEGKEASGLTATYMFNYIELEDQTKILITNFDNCQTARTITFLAPKCHKEDAEREEMPFYSIPRTKARKYTIIDDTLYEDGEV